MLKVQNKFKFINSMMILIFHITFDDCDHDHHLCDICVSVDWLRSDRSNEVFINAVKMKDTKLQPQTYFRTQENFTFTQLYCQKAHSCNLNLFQNPENFTFTQLYCQKAHANDHDADGKLLSAECVTKIISGWFFQETRRHLQMLMNMRPIPCCLKSDKKIQETQRHLRAAHSIWQAPLALSTGS